MASAQVQHDGPVIESLVAARFPRRRRTRLARDQTAQRRLWSSPAIGDFIWTQLRGPGLPNGEIWL